jgi:hypothetical protein
MNDALYYIETYLDPLFINFPNYSSILETSKIFYVNGIMTDIASVPIAQQISGVDNPDYVLLIELGYGCNLITLAKSGTGTISSGEINSTHAADFSISYQQIQQQNANMLPQNGTFCSQYNYYLRKFALKSNKVSNMIVMNSGCRSC